MKKIVTQIREIVFPAWTAPISLLLIMVAAFGLLINQLGFAYDEWHFVYYARRGMDGMFELFNYDGHPQSVWSYLLSFRLLGYNPTGWHIYSLALRWLAVLLFWLCLKTLWPAQKRQTFVASVIFALYPLFTLQVLPISYFEVWLSFCFLFLSFYLTLLALKQPNKFWIFTSLAILAKLAHAMTSEYTWFTEMMRPALIWFALAENLTVREKLKRTLQVWFPYLAIFAGLVLWRGLFYKSTRNSFNVPQVLLHNPLLILLGWAKNIIPDGIYILFAAWRPVLEPIYFDFSQRINLLLFGLAAVSAFLTEFYLSRFSPQEQETTAPETWPRQAVITGLLSILFGPLPLYIAGYTVYLVEQPINSRIALGALPGAALVITALLEKLITNNKQRLITISILIGLLISWHVRYENDFRQVWNAQRNFLRQLTWRVPGLEKNTTLISISPYLPPMENSPAVIAARGDFPIALFLNTLYETDKNPGPRLSYWYAPGLERIKIPIDPENNIHAQHATAQFNGRLQDSLFFYFDPLKGQCLHILRPRDGVSNFFPPPTREVAIISDPTRIITTHPLDTDFLDIILGPDNPDKWCYFYQKADLASQFQDWDTVNRLWKEAGKKGFQPSNGIEYIPFIEAALQTSDWKKAFDLTRTAKLLDRQSLDIACMLWRQVDEKNLSKEQLTEFTNSRDTLRCSRP